jgi:Flp pilus assembly protein TadG
MESKTRKSEAKVRASGRSRPESGQSMLEFALVTPLVLALLLGVIEIGRYAYIGVLVGSAARAGAAYASEHLGNAGGTGANGILQAADNDYQNNGQNPADLTVTWTTTCGCDNGSYPIATQACDPGVGGAAPTCAAGSHWVVMVSVEAKGTFTSLFSYPGIPSPITIDRTATMRVAQN